MVGDIQAHAEARALNFLSGTHDMRSDKLEKVLTVLGLEIRPKE